MKACRVHHFGPPAVISLEEVPRPEPGENEVLVKVACASVGPWDAWVRAGKSGLPQPLPLTLGSDLSGHVAALGSNVMGFELGQAVFGVTNPRFVGAYAEYAVASAAMLAPKPRSATHVAAAAAPVVSVTAWQMLFDHGKLASGQRVLIHGAGGSVGACAVQLALSAGAHVIGTVTRGTAYVASLGASQVIEAQTTPFEQVIEPVDLVIDTVGGDVQDRSFQVLKRGGSLISAVSPPKPELGSQYGVRALFIFVDVTRAALTQIAELIDNDRLKIQIAPVRPLSAAQECHEMLEGLRPRPVGKMVLAVGEQAESSN